MLAILLPLLFDPAVRGQVIENTCEPTGVEGIDDASPDALG